MTSSCETVVSLRLFGLSFTLRTRRKASLWVGTYWVEFLLGSAITRLIIILGVCSHHVFVDFFVTGKSCLWLNRAAARQNQQKYVRQAKTKISLGFRPVWSESLLCAQWVVKDITFLRVHMRTAKTLIRLGGCTGWAFAGCTSHCVCFVVLRLIYVIWVFPLNIPVGQTAIR